MTVSARTPLPLTITGLSTQDADDLCTALEVAAPGRFYFERATGGLSDLDPSCLERSVILAGSTGLPTGQSLLEVARQLRSERFFWGSLHLFLRNPPRQVGSGEWNLRCHRLPSEDVRALVEDLSRDWSVHERNRAEIVRRTLVGITDDLGSLRRSTDPSRANEPERVREKLRGYEASLSLYTADLPDIVLLVRALLGKATLLDEDLDPAISAVVSTETRMGAVGPMSTLRSELHSLGGTLRLARWRPEAAVEIAHRIEPRLTALGERGAAALPGELCSHLRAICDDLVPLVRSVLSSPTPGGLAERLRNPLLALRSIAARLEPHQAADSFRMPIQRIVVIEDDPDWSKEIVGLLESLDLPVAIHHVGAVDEAEETLKAPGSALALVDLVLPASASEKILLEEGGLALIERFSTAPSQGSAHPHRFIVLTGRENHSAAVREALRFGISPTSYLQKDPLTWESNLRSQVRLSLQLPADQLPLVDVFLRTKRVARVEGLEITLDYPEWCLLACFARSRSGWHSPRYLAEHLAAEPYNLDPASNDEDDPEDRIERQIPDYAAKLRKRLTEAYQQARHEPPPVDFIQCNDLRGYRLFAAACGLDRVEEHFERGRRPTVLVVEDDLTFAQEITNELQHRGFETVTAHSTEEAWERSQQTLPDLVSLDLELPQTEADLQAKRTAASNAVDLLRRLQQTDPGLPVAILTGVPWRDREMLEILREGVRIDDYLSKYGAAPIPRLAGSLWRLWQEWLTRTQILDWDPSRPAHPIKIDPRTGLLCAVRGYPFRPAKGNVETVLKFLSSTPNVFTSRTDLVEAVWPDPSKLPPDPSNALDVTVSRLRREIRAATGGSVAGDEIICGSRGVLWLSGIVQ